MDMRILIADDEPLIRLDLKELLQGFGYTVVGEASDGGEALRKITELKPDIAILDIKMSGLDGIAVAELVARDIPVILLTAYSSPPLVRAAKTAGVMAYVTKPFRTQDIPPAIELALENFIKQSALSGTVEKLKLELEGRKAVDKAKAVLMNKQKMSEAEAFRYIQKVSMEKNISMKNVAEAILITMG